MRRALATFLAFFSTLAWAGQKDGRRQVFQTGGHYLVVEALRDDLLHFEVGTGVGDPNQPIYTTPMVAKTDYTGPTRFVVTGQNIETATLRATVDDRLCVTVYDLTRQSHVQTVCPEQLDQPWKNLVVQSPATRNVYGLGQYFAEERADGDWLGRVWDPLADGYGARLRGFAGGANGYSMFPIMYALADGNAAYAMFVDQIYKQMWDFRQSPWRIGMWGDQIRWFYLQGQDLPALRRSYMELTGRPPVPPKRSFGLWVSEFGFRNWGEVKASLVDLRQNHFPVEGFALDLQWFGGTFGDPDHSRMGSLRWDEQNFPNPREEIAQFAADGVNLMLIEEPFISKTLDEHQSLEDHQALAKACATCGPTYLNYNPWWGRGGMVDFTSPAAGDYWHDYRRKALVDMGIHDHWADLGEPEQYDASSWYYGFPELGKHGHADIHNIYGFRWMQSIWRGYQRHHEGQRPFLLSRTGTSGIQRFGVGMWSGDTGTNWANLRSQMNVQMHMSLSGIDYYGSDVGGFQRSRGGIEGGGERLYTQWFASSAALDVPVRPHAWNLDKARSTAPSARGDLVANRENLRLRYRLTPYYYSLAHEAQATGEPVFPPLVYRYQSDANVREIGNEKLIGRDLLVTTVADPVASTQAVYLPAGGWIDFHTGEWIVSRGMVVRDRPLYGDGYFRLPLFARAGAILPMTEIQDQTKNNRRAADQLTVRVYASEQATAFDLKEDDGETFGYDAGEVATTRIRQQQLKATLLVDIAAQTGSYRGMPPHRAVKLELFAKDSQAKAVQANGENVPFTNSAQGSILVNLGQRAANTSVRVEVTLAPRVPAHPSGVLACLGGQTTKGTAVYAVGNIPALGGWQPTAALRLDPAAYPTWTTLIENLPADQVVEWKCIRRSQSGKGEVVWQQGANNRLETTASGYAGASSGSF